MFTGIIETVGKVVGLQKEGGNLHIEIESGITSELKIDQSISHNGVCLTVVEINGDSYKVTAVEETLIKTNLGKLLIGDPINLERAMISGSRLDGHMVQGHVDQVAHCKSIESHDGSWIFQFEFPKMPNFLMVEKGSICVDGVSLTVVEVMDSGFTVAIIPFTHEHTVFGYYKTGSVVNIEFDIIGKYVHQYMHHFKKEGGLQ